VASGTANLDSREVRSAVALAGEGTPVSAQTVWTILSAEGIPGWCITTPGRGAPWPGWTGQDLVRAAGYPGTRAISA
jgi:hypothetical protein